MLHRSSDGGFASEFQTFALSLRTGKFDALRSLVPSHGFAECLCADQRPVF